MALAPLVPSVQQSSSMLGGRPSNDSRERVLSGGSSSGLAADGAVAAAPHVKPPLSVTTSNLNAHMLRTAERQALEHASLVDPRVSEPAADRIRMSVMTTIESEHSREDLRDSSRSSILLEEEEGHLQQQGRLLRGECRRRARAPAVAASTRLSPPPTYDSRARRPSLDAT